MAALQGHAWPGNIRELKNAVERAVYRTPPGEAVAEIVLDPFASPWRPKGLQTGAGTGAEALAPAAATPALPYDFRAEIAAVEKRWLEAALQAHAGHQGRTATTLGLGYDQLRHLLKKHGLSARSGGDDT
jgi:psp operon transcriptional activator